MLTRFIPVVRTVGAVSRQQAVRCMGGHAPAHFKTDKQIALDQHAHMNNLPVPQGSWQENYSKRNARWNLQLAVSALFLVATTFVVYKNEIFYMHGHPPMKN